MTPKSNPSVWLREVRSAVQACADDGVKEVTRTKIFRSYRHVAIQVRGLDGVGVIHQVNARSGEYKLCVFEPSRNNPETMVEVFERNLNSLADLKHKITEWYAFRARTSQACPEGAIKAHKRWLQAVAKDKKLILDSINEAAELRRRGSALASWKVAGFELKFKQELSKSAPEQAKNHLWKDFLSIAPDLLAWHLPRDDTGKWLLKRKIPILRYDRKPTYRKHQFCLFVETPQRRGEPCSVVADWLDAELQSGRIDTATALVDAQNPRRFASELMGIPTEQLRSLWDTNLRSRSKTAQVLNLQMQAKLDEACERAGLVLDESIDAVRRGERVTPMCTCCAPLDEQLIAWSEQLTTTLLEMNLSAMGQLVLRDQLDCQRKPNEEPIPIRPFAKQRHNSKAQLCIDAQVGRPPRLCVAMSAREYRVPLAMWQRPVDIDLLREGLMSPKDLPMAVAQQLGA